MTTSNSGTIAQLLYAQKHKLNFADIVGDLHASLVRVPSLNLIFEWDCDDIALFDLSDTRIALGWDASPGKGYAACLTISVGRPTEPPLLPFGSGHQHICSQLVERLQTQFPPLATLWHQVNEHLTADLIDRLIEDLPPAMQLFPFEEPQWVGDTLARQLPRSPAATPEKTELIIELVTSDTDSRGSGVDARRKAREAVQYLQAIRASARAKATLKQNAGVSRQRDVNAFGDLHYDDGFSEGEFHGLSGLVARVFA